MFGLTDRECEELRTEIERLIDGGEEVVAKAWLVWAELHLNTIFDDSAIPNRAKKMLPLVFWISRDCGMEPTIVQGILKDLIPKILFQAKLEGRELSAEDGLKVIEIFRAKFKTKAKGTYD